MSAAPRRWAAELLHFWFHRLSQRDWYRGGAHVDAALEKRFARELAMLWPRPAEDFLTDPHTARAAILLFDQLPRNLFRDSPRAFAFDPLARTIAREVILRGWDSGLAKVEKHFIAMPLMHSEHISDQLWSLRYFAALGRPGVLAFARSHYRMIARFGRFPHRNEVLGRASTLAELAAVKAGNSW